MRDDDQKPAVNDDSGGDCRERKPWATPRLVPLDISSTGQTDDDVPAQIS